MDIPRESVCICVFIFINLSLIVVCTSIPLRSSREKHDIVKVVSADTGLITLFKMLNYMN